MNEPSHPAGVIFDLGGVILEFDHMTICRPLSELAGMAPEEVYAAIFSSGLEELYDKGKISTEEFYREGCDVLGISPSELSIDEFGRIWGDIFSVNAQVLGIINRLRKRTKLYLLSNTNELHFTYATKKLPSLEDTFDGVFLSFRLGTRKPEPEIFRAVIDNIALPPEKLFYIDDFPGHVEAAAAHGISGMVFTGPTELDDRLRSLGL